MAKASNRKYPNKSRIMFDGGLNNKFQRTIIQDNESPDCANVMFDNGAVETRGGTSKLNTTAVGSYVCDGLFTRHNNNGAQTMVAWFNGDFYDWTGSTFATVPSAQSLYTAGNRIYSAEYENYMFFGDGTNTPYKYGGDSDTYTRHGVPAPASGMTAATAATGSVLSGAYQYKVTYVNSNLVEGDLSSATDTFTAASENVALTGIPVAPTSFGVNQRRLYRTETSGAVFKRLATINDNTTTTYEDGVIDDDLGVTGPTDNGEPPNYSAIVYHQARLFVIDPDTNLIKYSEIGNPYVFASTSFLRVGDNSFDIPTGFSIYDNSIIVTCQNNPWLIYMGSTDPADWRVLRIRANFGSKSPFSAFKFNSQVMFAAVQEDKFVGFAAINGQTVSPSASLLTSTAVGSELRSDRIEPDMFDVQEGQLANISSIVFQNKAYISLTKGAGNTTNNRMYVYDFSLGTSKQQEASWVPWTGLNANNFTILDGVLYYGTSTDNGFVYSMNNTTFNDDGAAIDSYIWTKEFDGLSQDINIFKDYRYAQIFFEKSGDYFMDFTVKVDSDKGSGDTSQIDLDPGGSIWGTMRWGDDPWGGGNDEGEERKFISPLTGKRIQFKFSNRNTADQKFKVLGLNFVYNNKGLR